MKLFTACLVAVLCLSAVTKCQTTTKSNITWSDIAGKLPAGCKLEKPEPSGKDNVTCQGLWYKEGYVCNKNAVLDYAAKDKLYFDTGIKSFEGLLDTLSNFGTFAQSKSITGLSFNETEKAILNKYANKASFDQKKANARACMNELARIRNSALCTMCSAKNVLSFNNDKKGFFSNSNCDAFLTICDPHFNDYIELYHSVDMIIKIDKAVSIALFFNGEIVSWFVDTFKAVMYLLTTRIHQRAAATDLAVKAQISKAYCEQVIKLVVRPYLPGTLMLLSFGYKLIYSSTVMKYTAQQAAANLLAKATSIFGNWGRKLQSMEALLLSLPPYNPPADIEVKDTDNMFVSYAGATGTNYETEPYRALNLTLAFP